MHSELYARFIWREPSTGKPYDIEWAMNLVFVPRPGEEIAIKAESNALHSFAFDEVFRVEQVTYDIRTSPSTSSSPEESWKVLAYEQNVLIYVKPLFKSGWSVVQQIKKEFRTPRERKTEDKQGRTEERSSV